MSVTTGLSPQPSPLPIPLTPLLGREHEATELLGMLSAGANRLVTIIGPGGVGKTRLALHVAASIVDQLDHPVAYVPLASIHAPTNVLPAIVQSFGVFSDAQDAPEDQLVEVLHDQHVLLVLDNFEQVRDAASSLANVLSRCPNATMLVTSQASLGIAGEQLYPLHPLTTPPMEMTAAEDILESDAVALFLQRARAVNPHLVIDDQAATTLAEICRRLDGLPLAIELAAARVNILSPEALLSRLSNRLKVLSGERRDVPDRLRTMRNAIAWSYDLLVPDEQRLLRHMAVFAGGISLEAVESIVDSGDSKRDAYDVLGTLVNHSLVRTQPSSSGEARFLMLETLRDFGLEQLAQLGEEHNARLAHAGFVVHLAELAEPHFTGADQQQWLERLEPEADNLRVAAEWSLANGHAELALRIGGALWRFCATRGLAADCRDWIMRALADTHTSDSPYRLRAILGAAHLFEDIREMETAQQLFEQVRDSSDATSDPADHMQALIGLGMISHDQGNYADALDLHTEALRIARHINDPRGIAVTLGNTAAVYYLLGRLDDAERCWSESLSLFASLGDLISESVAASNLGALALERSELAEAERMQMRALDLHRQLRTSRDLPYSLINLGEILYLRGDFTQSHDCYSEAIMLLRADKNTRVEGIALNGYARLALAQGTPYRAASLLLDSMNLLAGSSERHGMIDNTELLASICSAIGRHHQAVELLAAATRHRADMGASPTPHKVQEIDAITAAARQALDPATCALARRSGEGLDFDAMIHHVTVLARQVVGQQHPSIVPSTSNETEATTPNTDINLTARELDVLRLLAQGCSTAEISEQLYISPRTTTTHVTNILGKLDVSSRTAAVVRALHLGLV